MPGFNRAIFYFSDSRFGWTETYWDASGGSPSLQATMKKAIALAQTRTPMLASGAAACASVPCTAPSLVAIRVSNSGNPRQSLFVANGQITIGNQNTTQNTYGKLQTVRSGSTAPDNPYSAMGLLMNLNNNSQSKRALSGVPDTLICDQSFDNDNAWIEAAKTFIKKLVSDSWGSISATRPTDPPAGSYITAITQDQYGHPVITLTAPIPAQCNTRLTVWNYVAQPRTPSINGTYRAFPGPITGGNASQWTLRKVFTPLDELCLGNAIVYAPTVVAFSGGILTRPVKKSRGRPTSLPRGRSRQIR